MVAQAAGSDFPNKPIKMVIPFAPGGFTDVWGRILAGKMGEELKTTVIVENRTGAGGMIGAAAVARAEPDGYTILLANNAVYAINQSLFDKVTYDAQKDFNVLTVTSRADLYLAVNPNIFKATTFPELKAEIDALPKDSPKRSYASVGIGSTHHLAMELLKRQTGLNILHVPYKGAAPAMQDLVGGQVSLMFNTYNEIYPLAKEGKVRLLNIARAQRSTLLPDLPTLAEQGVKDFDVWGWQALAVPAATPAPIVAKIRAAYEAAARDTATNKKFEDMGAPAVIMSGEDTRKLIDEEVKRWATVIKEGNIRAN
ncbi:hypothetical protein A9974_24135 [Achromobacter sp. UMC71]|nr:hypothetical protein [Achromobacter sp. UMC71]